ncbi:hypothetical protein CWI37_0420p0010 [Hamiltosporidium tvaerminnensis]|uniref:Uncharacterized protein n=1 Tax=Hamiltosporidium tvaerminnensis TaxID=1176355 RepID=A0A4Q9L667_9MICR|nr:hypothetical protein CWI37_0420p0010 [Hamiltosporidium tvaerminnensis]
MIFPTKRHLQSDRESIVDNDSYSFTSDSKKSGILKQNTKSFLKGNRSLRTRFPKKISLNLDEKSNEYLSYLSDLNISQINLFLDFLSKDEILSPRNDYNQPKYNQIKISVLSKIQDEFNEVAHDIPDLKIESNNFRNDDIVYQKASSDSFFSKLKEKIDHVKNFGIKNKIDFTELYIFCQEIIEYEKYLFKKTKGKEILKRTKVLDINHSLCLIKKNSRFAVLSEVFFFFTLYPEKISNIIRQNNFIYVSFLLRIFALQIIKVLPKNQDDFESRYKFKNNLDNLIFYCEIFNLRKIFYNILLGFENFNRKAYFYQLLNILDFRQKLSLENYEVEEYLLFKSQLNTIFFLNLSPRFQIEDDVRYRKIIVLIGIVCYAKALNLNDLNIYLLRLTFSNLTNIFSILKNLSHVFLDKKHNIFYASLRESCERIYIVTRKEKIEKYSKAGESFPNPVSTEKYIWEFLLKLEQAIFKNYETNELNMEITDDLIEKVNTRISLFSL